MIDKLTWIWGVQVIFVYWCAGSCGWFGHGFGEFKWSSCIGVPVPVGGFGRCYYCSHCFYCRRRVCNSWTQDSSLLVKGSSQRGYSYTMGASSQVLRRRVSNRWPVKQSSQGRSTVPLSMQRFRNNGLHSQHYTITNSLVWLLEMCYSSKSGILIILYTGASTRIV